MFDHRFFGILVVCLFQFCCIANAQNYCAKVDFNRAAFSEFRQCYGKSLPVFVTKDYQTHREIRPYRPASRYYLGTNIDSYSCIESSFKFSMNAMTRIEAAVYLKSVLNAFIEIVVYDADRNMPVYSWRNETANGNWFLIHGEIRSTIPNAQVHYHFNYFFFFFK